MIRSIFINTSVWLVINLALLSTSAFSYLDRLETHKVTASVNFLSLSLSDGFVTSFLGLIGLSLIFAFITFIFSSILAPLNYDRRQRNLFSIIYIGLALLIVNSLLVPESSWSLKGVLMGLMSALFFLFTLIYLRAIFRCAFSYEWSNFQAPLAMKVLAVVAVVAVVSEVGGYPQFERLTAKEANVGKPDIIIIGLDSLRPDLIDQNSELMPYTTQFLTDMVVFPNAYTPLARTYPSWASMLSGRYPYETGAYFNLVPFSGLKSPPLLANSLQENGYSTIYAANERRFSNIDERYGFKQVVGPDTGLLDFVLGTISDNPIINISRRFEISGWLLPYVRSNRAAHSGFRPAEFTEDLQSALDELDPNAPLFLSAHFCEAHWPYFEEGLSDIDLRVYEGRQGKFKDYLRSLRVLDDQLEATITDLKNRGRLDNALLLVVSDHGESFSDEEISFANPNNGEKLTVADWGHGTRVANVRQSRVLVAMQVFLEGKRQLAPSKPADLVSLVDIYPTIRSAVGLPPMESSGISLFELMESPNISGDRRIISLETGFSVPAMSERSPNMAEVFQQGFFAYQLEENGYISIKPSKMPQLIDSKEVGVFDGRTMLTFGRYAGGVEQATLYDFGTMTVVTGVTPMDARQSPPDHLETALCTRFSIYPSVADSNFCSDALADP